MVVVSKINFYLILLYKNANHASLRGRILLNLMILFKDFITTRTLYQVFQSEITPLFMFIYELLFFPLLINHVFLSIRISSN